MATRVRSGLQLKQVDDKHKSSVFASDHQTTVLTCHLFFVFTNNEPLHLHQMIYIHQSHHSSGSPLHFNMSPTPQAFLHQPEEEQNPKPTPVHFKARHKIINLSLGLFFFFFFYPPPVWFRPRSWIQTHHKWKILKTDLGFGNKTLSLSFYQWDQSHYEWMSGKALEEKVCLKIWDTSIHFTSRGSWKNY